MTWCCENLKNTWCHLIPWRQEPHLRRFPRLLGCLSGIWLRVLDWTGHGLPICQETVFWSRVVTTPGCLAAMIESPVDTCGLLLINICWDGCCPDTCWSFFGRPTVFGIQRKCCISLVMTPNQGAYDPWRYVWYSVARALGLKWMMALGACLKLVMPSTVSVYQSINLLIDCSMSLSISICLYLSLSICLYLPLSIYLYLSIYLSFYLSISFYIFLFLSISIYMFLSIVSDHIFSYLIYLSISISISLLHPKDSAEVAIRESNIRGGVVPDGVQLGSQCHRGPGNKVWTHHGQSTLDSFPKMEVSKAADSKMMIFFTLFEPQLPSNGWLIYLIFTMCRSTCLCTTVSSSVCVFDEKSELGGLYLREQCTVPCSLKQSTVDRIKNYDKIPEKSCRKVMNSVLLVQNCTSYKARAILPACSRCRHRRRTAGGTQQNRARFCVMVPQSLRCYFDLIECYLHLIRCFTGDMKVHEARIFVNIWLQYITVWIVIRTWVSVLLSLKLLRLQTCIRTLSTRSMFKRSL